MVINKRFSYSSINIRHFPYTQHKLLLQASGVKQNSAIFSYQAVRIFETYTCMLPRFFIRYITNLIDSVEILGGVLLALSAGEEHDARHSCGHGSLQGSHCRQADLRVRGASGSREALACKYIFPI